MDVGGRAHQEREREREREGVSSCLTWLDEQWQLATQVVAAASTVAGVTFAGLLAA